MNKASDSSLPAPRAKKSEKFTTLTPELRKQLEALLAKPDSEIDFSDMPEFDINKMGPPIIGGHYRVLKKSISIRLDSDMLAWFQTQPKYQSLINKICREYYIKNK